MNISTCLELEFCFLGLLHSGYPIMAQMRILPRLIDETAIRSSGVWGATHELGHNFQQPAWQFPPHSSEADCNLWSIYVHEEVLKIPRERAHSSLKPESRRERIKVHLGMGAPLSNWNTWTALETYLQVLSGNARRLAPLSHLQLTPCSWEHSVVLRIITSHLFVPCPLSC